MEKLISANDVLSILEAYRHIYGKSATQGFDWIRGAVQLLPCRHITDGISLWDFKNSLAEGETVWLRDQSTGEIVAKSNRRLRRYRNVTVIGCYPAVEVENDGSLTRSVLVCWGDHAEITAADR